MDNISNTAIPLPTATRDQGDHGQRWGALVPVVLGYWSKETLALLSDHPITTHTKNSLPVMSQLERLGFVEGEPSAAAKMRAPGRCREWTYSITEASLFWLEDCYRVDDGAA